MLFPARQGAPEQLLSLSTAAGQEVRLGVHTNHAAVKQRYNLDGFCSFIQTEMESSPVSRGSDQHLQLVLPLEHSCACVCMNASRMASCAGSLKQQLHTNARPHARR